MLLLMLTWKPEFGGIAIVGRTIFLAMTPPLSLVVSREPLMSAGVRWFMLEKMQAAGCLEASNPESASTMVLQQHPGLILVAASVLSEETPRWVKDLSRGKSPPPILVIGRVSQTDLVRRVMRAGALGFVSILEDLEELRLAVTATLHGTMHLSGQAGHSLMMGGGASQSDDRKSQLQGLSDREKEVFDLIGQGFGQKEIATKLHISVKTVETHKQHLKEKLHLANAAQLSRAAVGHLMVRAQGGAQPPGRNRKREPLAATSRGSPMSVTNSTYPPAASSAINLPLPPAARTATAGGRR